MTSLPLLSDQREAVTPTPSSPVMENTRFDRLKLPELDVSRPITWGPLAFHEAFLERAQRVPSIVEEEEEEEWEREEPEPVKVEEKEKEVLNEPLRKTVNEGEGEPAEDEEEDDWENVFESKRASTASVERTHTIEDNEPAAVETSIPAIPPLLEESTAVEAEDLLSVEPTLPPSSMRVAPATPPPVTETETPPVAVEHQYIPPETTQGDPEPTDPPLGEHEHDTPSERKEREIVQIDSSAANSPASSTAYPNPVSRSKYIDRNITSFLTSEHVIRDESPPPVPRLPPAPIQFQPTPREPTTLPVTLEYLPLYMSAKDIPDMISQTQRIGAYLSRREKMTKADAGLRGWLLQVQQSKPSSTNLGTYV
jgi:hypothetical protein